MLYYTGVKSLRKWTGGFIYGRKDINLYFIDLLFLTFTLATVVSNFQVWWSGK